MKIIERPQQKPNKISIGNRRAQWECHYCKCIIESQVKEGEKQSCMGYDFIITCCPSCGNQQANFLQNFK